MFLVDQWNYEHICFHIFDLNVCGNPWIHSAAPVRFGAAETVPVVSVNRMLVNGQVQNIYPRFCINIFDVRGQMLEMGVGGVDVVVDLDTTSFHSFDVVGEGIVSGDVCVAQFGDAGVNIGDGDGN